MSGMLDRFALFAICLVGALIALTVVGVWTWSSWLRVLAIAVPFAVATRLLAPVRFGWRPPDEASKR